MSLGIVLLLVLCASGIGVGIGLFFARRGAAEEQARLTSKIVEAEAATKRARSDLDQIQGELADVQKKLADQAKKVDEQRDFLAKAEKSAKVAVAENEEAKQQLEQSQAALDKAHQRADSLMQDLERAHSKEPVDTLKAIRNDPDIGPGQYETLKLMYEQFTTKSILEKKPGE